MKVLIFLPSSHIAPDIVSLANYLYKNGLEVFFLSASPNGKMHEICEENNIINDSLNLKKINLSSYLKATLGLNQFVNINKIELIISNNLQGNFISILAQKIHRKRTILTRHHSDYISNGNNRNAKLMQRFVNGFGKEFIAVSDKVKQQMLLEGIKENKIHRINLGFDFSLFPQADEDVVRQLINEKKSNFKICVIARLIPLKRHILLFEAIRILVDQGEEIILWVIGDGPLKPELKEWVNFYHLEKVIHFTGYIENTQDYLSASNLLVHISESEASSHVIREAAIYETPVLVCKNVGDFEDYIVDYESGFFVDKDLDPKSLASKILELKHLGNQLKQTASVLKKIVLKRFDINENGENLNKLIRNE